MSGNARISRRIFDVASLILFGFAACCAMRLILAEVQFRTGVPSRVRKAMRIGNAAYCERMADRAADGGADLLRAAVRSNPRATSPRIALGLALEGAGQIAEARFQLSEAARMDHQYLPAWTLANFCFRRDDAECFWRWAHAAGERAYDGGRGIVELAARFDPDPTRVLDGLGGGALIEWAYLDSLIGQNNLKDAMVVARRMLARLHIEGGERKQQGRRILAHSEMHPSITAETGRRLAGFTDRLILAGMASEALEVWNGLGYFPHVDPEAGDLITNGDFARSPSGAGFDWRLPQVPGLNFHWEPFRLRLDLSEDRPETCPLVEQWIVTARRNYRLRFEYRTAGLPLETGLRWLVGKERSPDIPSTDSWRTADWYFSTAVPGLTSVRLAYSRPLGSTRGAGSITLRRVQLEAL
jgi:hypothetical protein